jgi:predicted molibdopterin-dependent oxidoreductase YjgC
MCILMNRPIHSLLSLPKPVVVVNAPVQVCSRRGSLAAVAFITPTVQPGQVFIPMHYAELNQLTCPSYDPHSRQPSYKHCAVALKKIRRASTSNGSTGINPRWPS